MPRFMIQRTFGMRDEADMQNLGARSARIADEKFPEITWEHSHIVSDSFGAIKSFCVYKAPTEQMVHEHAQMLGEHQVDFVYEIAGDIGPEDFRP
jgi:uncharacterized protein DUF4242